METVKKCANCKHVGKIYFPPTNCNDSVFLKGCFLFSKDNKMQVMYLDTLESLCECFEKRTEGATND